MRPELVSSRPLRTPYALRPFRTLDACDSVLAAIGLAIDLPVDATVFTQSFVPVELPVLSTILPTDRLTVFPAIVDLALLYSAILTPIIASRRAVDRTRSAVD